MIDFLRCFHKITCLIFSAVGVFGIACIAIGIFVLGDDPYSVFSNGFVDFSMITSYVGIVIEPITFVILLVDGIVRKRTKQILGDLIAFILTVSVIISFWCCLTLWIGI